MKAFPIPSTLYQSRPSSSQKCRSMPELLPQPKRKKACHVGKQASPVRGEWIKILLYQVETR